MHKSFSSILPVLIFLTNPLSAATQKKFTHCWYTITNMAIFIDERESDGFSTNSTISLVLSDALEDQSSILVVSNHLLNNISYFTRTDQTDWTAHRLSDNITVLVPKGLIAEYRTRAAIPPQITVDDDYILGIYFSRYPLLTQPDLTNKTIGKTVLSRQATDSLLALFIPRTDYWSNWKGEIQPRAYNLLFFAHGLEPLLNQTPGSTIIDIEGQIAGFVTSDKNRLLVNLSKTETIASVTEISCISGDLNQLSMLSKNHAHLADAREFHFPIIIATPLAAEVVTAMHKNNFKNFFDELTDNCDHPDFVRALQYIYPSSGTNIPIIKYPGLPVFFPLDPTKYGEIGTIMGASRTAPITIPDFFGKKELLAILVHPPILPFKVILAPGQDNLPLFFSAEPGPRVHQFAGGLDARTYPLSKIIGIFTATQQFENKIFSFSSITAQDDTIKRDNRVREFKDLAIINYLQNDNPTVLITYTLADQTGYKTLWFEKTIKTATDAKTLGKESITATVPLPDQTEKSIRELTLKIAQMAQNPTLVNPKLLVPQIEQVRNLLAKQAKKISSGLSSERDTNKLLNQFAKSMQKLAQP